MSSVSQFNAIEFINKLGVSPEVRERLENYINSDAFEADSSKLVKHFPFPANCKEAILIHS